MNDYPHIDIVKLLTCGATVFYQYKADEGALLKRAAAEITALRERVKVLEEALKPLQDFAELAQQSGCGDGNCVIWEPRGMHTNGGCDCVQTGSYDVALRATIAQLLSLAQKAARTALEGK